MFAALGAISAVSSLLDSAASSIGKAMGGGPTAPTFTASTPPAVQAKAHAAIKSAGGSAPSFDKRTLAHLLAVQEQHRSA
jgi:hypothetical protein